MKRNIIFIAFAVFIFTSASGLNAANPFSMTNDIFSVSHSKSPFSPIVNPALNDVPGSAVFAYRYMRFDDADNGNHYLLVKPLGFSISYIKFDHLYDSEAEESYIADSSFFNISRGFMVNNVFSFGLGYSFAKSKEDFLDDYRAWHVGLIFRPWKYVSFGISFNDNWAEIGGESLDRSETYSVSIRPYYERLTLSVDASRIAGDSLDDMTWSYGAELRTFSDVTFFAKIDTDPDSDSEVTFGVSMPFFVREPVTGRSSSMILDYSGFRGAGAGYNSGGITIPVDDYKDSNLLAENNYLYLKIDRPFGENEARPLFGRKSVDFYDLLNAVKTAGDDRSIDGIILEIDSVQLGFAQTQELREQLASAQLSGKPVYAIMKRSGNVEYYLASVADRIYYPPNTTFQLTGLSAQVYYIKGLLDKIGVKFETVRRGKFKASMEPFTEEGMSKEFRENLESLVGDLNNQFTQHIASGRSFSSSDVVGFLNEGVLTPEEALSRGFIDRIAYPGDAFNDISEKIIPVSLDKYVNEKSVEHSWGAVPDIAVIYVKGNIVQGVSSGSRFVENIGDDSYKNMLERVFSDKAVTAVVIRVNSGGGSASASDFMWKYLVEFKEKYDKPVVFSFGNVAASGGYYIACTEDKIFSSSGTITGSIGVIFGKVSVEELYDKLGINKEVVKESEFADAFSEARDMTEKERKMVERNADFIYDRFTEKVVEGRPVEREQIPEVAEGRVFTGAQAEEIRLIDEQGGLIMAIEYAASLAGVEDRYRVRALPEKRSIFYDMLSSPEIEFISRFFSPLMQQAEMLGSGDENVLYLKPYHIEVK